MVGLMNLPPVLDKKNVLQDHIQAKLKQIIPISSVISDLAFEICRSKPNEEILTLLVDDNLLKDAILKIKTDGNVKQKLGAQLFTLVSSIETSLCAQITGMLLELDVLTICQLLCDTDGLQNAVNKAKEEYLKFKQNTSKEFFGEQLYVLVSNRYPDFDLAAQLTGMLLELDVSTLQRLLDDSKEFNIRLETAYNVLKASEKNGSMQDVCGC